MTFLGLFRFSNLNLNLIPFRLFNQCKDFPIFAQEISINEYDTFEKTS